MSGQAQVREHYVTAREVAERLGLSADTILRYYREGMIPGRRMPGTIRPVRFLWCEVEAAWDGSPIRRPTRRGGSGPSGRRPGGVSAQRGQIFRAPAGSWAIRFYDARGQRHQRNGLPHAWEAREALEEELRRVRLGPLFSSARDGARAGRRVSGAVRRRAVERRRGCAYNLDTALQAARRRADRRALGAAGRGVAQCRCPRASGYPAHRALRQVLEAALRWKWIEENPAALVKNPAPQAGRDRSVRDAGRRSTRSSRSST